MLINWFFFCLRKVCVATIDKFSKAIQGELTPKNIEEQFRKFCRSAKNDKEKRLVNKTIDELFKPSL